ncbi:MAG TPA: hypothetical protein VFP68_10455 [Burkholderiaceae bacterium]|nr:hypothetical protein [Burkholderiaceae bacterium]
MAAADKPACQCLGIYDDEALDAWYDLYKTGRSEHFARLQQAAEA